MGLFPIRASKSEILEVFLLYSITAPLGAEVHHPHAAFPFLLHKPVCPGTAMGSNVKMDLLMIRHSSARVLVMEFFPIGLNTSDSGSAETWCLFVFCFLGKNLFPKEEKLNVLRRPCMEKLFVTLFEQGKVW